MTRVRNGVKSRVWQKTRARNEALDVRVYALTAFVNLNANLGSSTFVDKLFDNLLVTFTSRLMELSIVWHCPVE